MPGPHQWEATFSRTNHRLTAQADEMTLYRSFFCVLELANRIKNMNQVFFYFERFFYEIYLFQRSGNFSCKL